MNVKNILKLSVVKEFIKRFILINLIAITLAFSWIGIVKHRFRTDYENDLVKETAKFVYSDIVCFTPYFKNSSLSYLIQLDNATNVYIPLSYTDSLLDIEKFEKEQINQLITIEYNPEISYSYDLDSGKTISVSMLVSVRGANQNYFNKFDYMSLSESIEKEHYVGFFLLLGALYILFIILCAIVPFTDVKRMIIQNKKKRLKRAKREAKKQTNY